ncbi:MULTISPECIES: SDR family oxidoreductase [unclassified Sphingobium]|uniref:SDR family oxidoreductase n=1 Tax=unclassified Sphingobium TaxID=2611147 RepID=UPI002225302C|nr:MULTISPECIES: SDR family oxidoreductase [unclassified Sphingobium]MCW2411955.1 uncharacterized protein YbjT (DUF2867 family) [Sphingobium sp. B8D3D]MCW2415747.1 uncharacterized protein YbjT (DUF2867 family) [Sphingobium sp. B8D3A]
MRVLVLGAGGFIGREVMAVLLAAGHDLVATARSLDGLEARFPAVSFIRVDLSRALQVADWSPVLVGVDVIINCAGVLRGREMTSVHVTMPSALYEAARLARVQRVLLLSAISARPDVQTAYARTKLAGEVALRDSGVDWTVLRPSLVYGDGSYGGTSLMRGLAGLPWAIPMAGDGRFPFTPVHAQDLARAIRIVCEDESFAGQVLEPVGPDTMELRDLLVRYRRWLGFGDAAILRVPMPLMRVLGKAGDFFGSGPVSSSSLDQMVAGNAGDSAAFERAIGFRPRSLDVALQASPAQVQDRWHARLYFLAPALKIVLVLMWLVSAWLGFAHGQVRTEEVTSGLGLPLLWTEPLRIAGSLLDIAMAGWLLVDRFGRWSTLGQCLLIIGYTAVIGYALPELWIDPLGPLLKNAPILLAVLMHGAIADRR